MRDSTSSLTSNFNQFYCVKAPIEFGINQLRLASPKRSAPTSSTLDILHLLRPFTTFCTIYRIDSIFTTQSHISIVPPEERFPAASLAVIFLQASFLLSFLHHLLSSNQSISLPPRSVPLFPPASVRRLLQKIRYH